MDSSTSSVNILLHCLPIDEDMESLLSSWSHGLLQSGNLSADHRQEQQLVDL
jgi:hypothetical protein